MWKIVPGSFLILAFGMFLLGNIPTAAATILVFLGYVAYRFKDRLFEEPKKAIAAFLSVAYLFSALTLLALDQVSRAKGLGPVVPEAMLASILGLAFLPFILYLLVVASRQTHSR